MEKNEIYHFKNKLIFKNSIIDKESIHSICSSEEYINDTKVSVKGDISNILEFKGTGSDIAITKLINCFQENGFEVSSYIDIDGIVYNRSFEPNEVSSEVGQLLYYSLRSLRA